MIYPVTSPTNKCYECYSNLFTLNVSFLFLNEFTWLDKTITTQVASLTVDETTLQFVYDFTTHVFTTTQNIPFPYFLPYLAILAPPKLFSYSLTLNHTFYKIQACWFLSSIIMTLILKKTM